MDLDAEKLKERLKEIENEKKKAAFRARLSKAQQEYIEEKEREAAAMPPAIQGLAPVK